MKLLNDILAFMAQYQFDPLLAAKTIGATAAIFVFFQRIHSANQARVAKSINDAIIKINDLCIDAFYKNDPQLRVKVLMHITFLEAQINSFPYGGAIQQYRNSIAQKFRDEADHLYREYEEAITYNTPIENKGVIITDDSTREAMIDNITGKALNLSKMIESQLSLIF